MSEYAPSVSVVIPVYNGATYLGEAIGSVLAQDYVPLELIVVDDGSTDDSADVAAQFGGVLVIKAPHRGISRTLNAGIHRSTGELLSFLDADDRWTPGKLEKQVIVLTQDPALDIVFGHVRQFVAGSSRAVEEGEMSVPQPGIGRSAMLIRRRSFDRVGDFSIEPGMHDFMDWYARAIEMGLRSRMLDDIVFERRIHDQNVGRRTPERQRQAYFNTLRAALARRRSPAEPSGRECGR
ncbi:MAG: glycosyltransferase family 2 protein [Chloroflexi bacterium]|nr:glycosyltransferase family 2 protein [Chloroflexota bacterium]